MTRRRSCGSYYEMGGIPCSPLSWALLYKALRNGVSWKVLKEKKKKRIPLSCTLALGFRTRLNLALSADGGGRKGDGGWQKTLAGFLLPERNNGGKER